MILDHGSSWSMGISFGQRYNSKTYVRSLRLRCVEMPGDEMGLGAGTVADGDELLALQISRPSSDPSDAAFWPFRFHVFCCTCFGRLKDGVA